MPRQPNARRTLLDLTTDQVDEVLACYDTGRLKDISQSRAAKMLNITTWTLRSVLACRDTARTQNAVEQVLDCCLDDVRRYIVPVNEPDGLSQRPAAALNGTAARNRCSFSPPAYTPPGALDFYDRPLTFWELIARQHRVQDVYGLVQVSFVCASNSRPAAFATGTWSKPTTPPTVWSRPPPPTVWSRSPPQTLNALLACSVDGAERLRPVAVDNRNDPSFVREFRATLELWSGDEWTVHAMDSLLAQWDRRIGELGRRIAVVLDGRLAVPANAQRLRNIALLRMPRDHGGVVHPLAREVLRVTAQYESRMWSDFGGPPPPKPPPPPPPPATSAMTAVDFMYVIADVWRCLPAAVVRHCFGTTFGPVERAEHVDQNVDANFARWVSRYRDLCNNQDARHKLENLRDSLEIIKVYPRLTLQSPGGHHMIDRWHSTIVVDARPVTRLNLSHLYRHDDDDEDEEGVKDDEGRNDDDEVFKVPAVPPMKRKRVNGDR